MVPVTHSGIKIRRYLEWLVVRREEHGLFHGPAFCDQIGNEIESGVYEGLILEVLHAHQDWERKQSSNDHKLLEGVDIDERYGIFRSFNRGAITRAQEAGVSESDVNRVGAMPKGRQAGGSMREHYSIYQVQYQVQYCTVQCSMEVVQLLDAKTDLGDV
jgi:hypothetical protein